MKSVVPTIECPTCDGKGKVALPDQLYRTLQVVKKLNGVTAPQLKTMMDDPINTTGYNNRLENLFRLNLLNRKRRGRAWYYYA